MLKNLSGKTAIVTGSSRGIGAGIAIDLAKRGANIVVNYTSHRGEFAGGEVVKEIEAAGTKAALVQANFAHLSDLKRLVEAALTISENGKIDILVHNAASGDDCYMEDMTEEFYQSQTDVNLKAPIFLTQMTLPHISRGGRIILVSSVSARMGMPQQTVYAGTKAALEGIAKVWATELGKKYGITVNCVSPGPVATDMWTECEPDVVADFQPIINATPAAARVGEVSDIVPVVSFLCSEESRWVTGSTVSASGGMNFI
ncbi:NAD(P)-binding protein [Stipitochalara longipes BDJ]|nr:NAD(P)-binding protein [Stipitochalara longipes BDJ]